ncbi:MAG: hypothetical protein ACK42Z_06020 [Candidatus Kapaibacteriota bacterium]
MSPTQKYSPEFIEEIISQIEVSAQKINELLSTEEEYTSIVDKLIEILNQRERYFKEFETFQNENSISFYFVNNYNNWRNRIKCIMDIEKKNLDKIENFVKLQSDRVKNLNKQKQLLLYMKR